MWSLSRPIRFVSPSSSGISLKSSSRGSRLFPRPARCPRLDRRRRPSAGDAGLGFPATRNGPFRRRRSRISVLQADADRSDKEPRLRSRQAIFRGIEFGSSENAIWFLRSDLQAKENVPSWCDGVSQFAREAMAQAGLGNALEQRPRSRAYPRETERRPFT